MRVYVCEWACAKLACEQSVSSTTVSLLTQVSVQSPSTATGDIFQFRVLLCDRAEQCLLAFVCLFRIKHFQRLLVSSAFSGKLLANLQDSPIAGGLSVSVSVCASVCHNRVHRSHLSEIKHVKNDVCRF